jgi:hypothetical protein
MSRWLYWLNNRKQNFCLLYSIQRTAMERLDSITRRLHKESNESNQHEQSGQSIQSFKCDCDAGSNAYCTCTRTTTRASTGSACGSCTTTGRSATSSRSASTNGSSTTANSLVRKHKYTTITTSQQCANDILNREYAEYLASTNTGREDASTGIRVSDEPRNFKPTDADSTDPIERRIGIPAGVTV